MTITFTMTPEEAARGSVAYMKAVIPERSRTPSSVLPYLLFGLFVYVFDRHMWWANVLAFGMASLLLEVVRSDAQRRRVTKALNGPELTPLPTTVDVSPDDVRFTSAGVEMRFAWCTIVRVVEDSRFFLFTAHGGQGQMIPKRTLRLAEDREFRRIVIERSPDHGASLRPELTAAEATVLDSAAA